MAIFVTIICSVAFLKCGMVPKRLVMESSIWSWAVVENVKIFAGDKKV